MTDGTAAFEWVSAAESRIRHEWSSAGLTPGGGKPVQEGCLKGGSLVLIRSRTTAYVA
jgi:hypothetical protein